VLDAKLFIISSTVPIAYDGMIAELEFIPFRERGLDWQAISPPFQYVFALSSFPQASGLFQ